MDITNGRDRVNPTVEVVGLHKLYGRTRAVSGLSFSIESGQVVVLLGGNAAGKTTVLKLIAGLTPMSGGAIRLNGHDLTTERAAALQQTEMLAQGASSPADERTVWDTVCHSPQCRQLLIDLELWERRKRAVCSLSHGLQPRVALARILSSERPILLFDEPLTGLEEQAAHAAQMWIRRLARNHDKTCLVATCQIELAQGIGNRILVIRRGHLVADVTVPPTSGLSEPAVYQVRVRGRLDGHWQAWFTGSVIAGRNGETLMTVPVADQPALHALLNQIRDLGLTIVSIQRLESALAAALPALRGDLSDGNH